MFDFKNITVEINNAVATVAINRPEVYGALTREAKLELISAIRKLNRDNDVKSLVLTGTSKAFCSGQDLNDRTVKAGDRPVDLGVTLAEEWNPLVNAIRESKKIVIGAINGVCAGAGVSVALACDMIVCDPKVKFVSGFSKLGLCPDAGSTSTFSKALGEKKAMEFFLFNQPLMAEQMKDYGLINMVDENYTEIAQNWASEVASMAPLAVQMIKENIRNSGDVSYHDSMERETYCQRFLGNSEDYKEGLNAFFEKRAPQFKGQ